jgi:hypothetical protein
MKERSTLHRWGRKMLWGGRLAAPAPVDGHLALAPVAGNACCSLLRAGGQRHPHVEERGGSGEDGGWWE